MKIAIFFFSLFFSVLNAQNKNIKLNYIEKNIKSCRIPLNDSLSIYKIQENLYNNDIEIVLKTEDMITAQCLNQIIDKELILKLNTSQNPLIKINKNTIEGLNITDFSNLIPNKISAIKKAKYTILLVELYSFSYSTVGSGYIDLCFKIDTNREVVAKKILESKSSITVNKLKNVF